MHEPIGDRVRKNGFAFLPRHFPEKSTHDAAKEIGAVVQVLGLGEVQTLVPRTTEEATPNVYSGNYGMQAFPLHTDLAHWHIPPRYLALRCVVGTNAVSTVLLSGALVVADVGERVLRRALVMPRRPLGFQRSLLRLYEERLGAWCLRWDDLFLVPASSAGARACAAVRSTLAASAREEVVLREPGDTLVLDNWRMLHGRSRVAPEFKKRRIERAYLGEVF